MNTDNITFMSTIPVFVSMVLQFGNEWPLSAHAQKVFTNWVIEPFKKKLSWMDAKGKALFLTLEYSSLLSDGLSEFSQDFEVR